METNLRGFSVYSINQEEALRINFNCKCSRCEKPIEKLFLVPAVSKVFCKTCLPLWRAEYGSPELLDEMANTVNLRYYKKWLGEGS